jgi:hypothetical protein
MEQYNAGWVALSEPSAVADGSFAAKESTHLLPQAVLTTLALPYFFDLHPNGGIT